MIETLFKVGLRNLVKNKVYSIISILGLALSISCCILIAMWVFHETSFDKHHEKVDRIYRLTSVLIMNGEIDAAVSNLPSGPQLKEDYPEVEEFVRFRSAGQRAELSTDDKLFYEENVWFADSTLFDVFTYTSVQGDLSTALTKPFSIVLTERSKHKFFGNDDAVGKVLKINNSELTVTAVIENPLPSSEIQANAFISMNTLPEQFFTTFNQDWFRIGLYTYLLFKDKPNVAEFTDKLVDFEQKYVMPWAEQNQVDAGLVYGITPLADLHFDNTKQYDLPKGNKNYVYLFSLLALFILIIAGINYINLSLAQSSKRAKEVGIRKTLGSSRKELILQFLSESALVTILAAIVGLALVEVLLGWFGNLTDVSFTSGDLFQPKILLTLIALIVLISGLAGSYPALVLSRFNPVVVLKGVIPKSGGIGMLRKVLILIQFTVSLFMITGTLLIRDQVDYLRSMNLGFDQENILTMRVPADTLVSRQITPWVESLRNDSRVKSITQASLPTGGGVGELMFRIEQEGELTEQPINFISVDQEFMQVLNLELIEGRNFSRDIQTDAQQAFIINERAVEQYGWQDEPLGKRMQWGLLANNQATNDGKVIGVVKDFHFLSLQNELEPVVLLYNPNAANTINIKFNKGDYTGMIKELEARWVEMAPRHPFDYSFYDDILDRNYRNEERTSAVFSYFAVLSILVAALGLFALVSFSIETRIKEIGMRKVLGASSIQVLWVLAKDFFIALLVAFVIASPVNFIFMRYWLEGFAYDVPISVFSFVISLLIALILAIISMSYHVWKIAVTDPVHALRYE